MGAVFLQRDKFSVFSSSKNHLANEGGLVCGWDGDSILTGAVLRLEMVSIRLHLSSRRHSIRVSHRLAKFSAENYELRRSNLTPSRNGIIKKDLSVLFSHLRATVEAVRTWYEEQDALFICRS